MEDQVPSEGKALEQPMHFRAARSRRLYEDVVQQIIELIDSQQLQPGTRLPPEREIAKQISVSRNVLREAFRVLEERGIIISRQGGGRFVRAVDAKIRSTGDSVSTLEVATIVDALEARTLLEGQIVALACQRRTAEEGQRLRELAERGATWQDNVDFHVALANATHNFLLVRMVREQLDLLHELHQRDHYAIPEQGGYLHGDHVAIADAIVARDAPLAQQLLREHLGHTQESLEGIDPSDPSAA
ncbi:FadR/GntR family transcriptional regulator [Streptomyces sp900129855]|jgi:GntR family transcriptional repressor for pyruvate dehydrogenase complex|uniref:FadR/GntR family transcriptional regulator n=1 Tax=Streptomyces sp. 900129855 TaxID=3155129 RepID=A0ABV2ZV10_9ACTN